MNVVRICLFIEKDEAWDNPGVTAEGVVPAVSLMIADYSDPWHCLGSKVPRKVLVVHIMFLFYRKKCIGKTAESWYS